MSAVSDKVNHPASNARNTEGWPHSSNHLLTERTASSVTERRKHLLLRFCGPLRHSVVCKRVVDDLAVHEQKTKRFPEYSENEEPAELSAYVYRYKDFPVAR